jgi:hypothetical protein
MEANTRPETGAEAHSRSCRIIGAAAIHRKPKSAGVALIITLFVLSILTILIIGFLSTMLLERRAATAYSETQQAKLVAQGALAHAIDLLRTNIPDPAAITAGPDTAPGINWVINPGRLTLFSGNNSTPQYVSLHTGAVTAPPASPTAPRDAESYDLNRPLPGQTTPLITGTMTSAGAPAPVMRVQWVNLQSDPTKPAGATNPLAARYAFWIDDECARLNFNVASGKPPNTPGTTFGDELQQGFMTPTFTLGDPVTVYGGTGMRVWGLGHPESVNLDVLFTSPSQLLANQLLDNTFLHGFSRYPEAILNFVNVPSSGTSTGTPASAWFDQQRYNLTCYSRSPEFNAFGRSRFFTTNIPISLEGGPSCQHPFIYGATSNAPVLNLNSLFGTFGFTNSVTTNDAGGGAVTTDAGNVVNAAQVNMLMMYMARQWPGFNASFLDKYGYNGCYQIALNMLVQARLATTTIATDLTGFSQQWGLRTTSVNYAPSSDEYVGQTPERFYWRYIAPNNTTGQPVLMLPQTPGPHITEVRLFVQPVSATSNPPEGKPANLKPYTLPRYIQYWFEVKYYMHPFGPVVDPSQFPTQVAYLDVSAAGGGQTPTPDTSGNVVTQEFTGPAWTNATTLGLFKITPPITGTPLPPLLGPTGATFPGYQVQNRMSIATSPAQYFTIGQPTASHASDKVPTGSSASWTPLVFDAAKGTTVSVKIRFRPGMSVGVALQRPRQMIPLGLTPTDTLQATFSVDLTNVDPVTSQQAVSWQIADPRLSGTLSQWQMSGPGEPSAIGNPNAPNANEPAETSTQKSKFCFIERAPTGAAVTASSGVQYPLDRPDEYDSQSRVSSPGYWSTIHTGMQPTPTLPVQPWSTLNLGLSQSQPSPPDWLLLDLFAPTDPLMHDQWEINNGTLPDSFSTVSYMNSTAGQVNLNSAIYPQTAYFTAPARTLPLQGVFQNLRSTASVQALLNDIATYQKTNVFDYVGRLADLPDYPVAGATQWVSESLLRNMAGCLTTRSNTFGVWGVAEVVKKLPKNLLYDQFQTGDQVLAEKRFYAIVERYVWPGRDGVPGNGHVNSGSGLWDRLAVQTAPISISGGVTDTLFQLPGSPPLVRTSGTSTLSLDTSSIATYPIFDGPQQVGMDQYTAAALGNVAWTSSALQDAYNPPQAVIKYRVVYFKYLDQ